MSPFYLCFLCIFFYHSSCRIKDVSTVRSFNFKVWYWRLYWSRSTKDPVDSHHWFVVEVLPSQVFRNLNRSEDATPILGLCHAVSRTGLFLDAIWSFFGRNGSSAPSMSVIEAKHMNKKTLTSLNGQKYDHLQVCRFCWLVCVSLDVLNLRQNCSQSVKTLWHDSKLKILAPSYGRLHGSRRHMEQDPDDCLGSSKTSEKCHQACLLSSETERSSNLFFSGPLRKHRNFETRNDNGNDEKAAESLPTSDFILHTSYFKLQTLDLRKFELRISDF